MLRHTIKKERPAPVTRTATRRNAAGHDLGTVDLEPTVFGLEPNRAVLHQVVTAQLAAARAGTQSTKTRAEVRGGGAKPFRQKGTGRARQGSSRSPSMSGGGVALGPKPRSYAQHTPKKMVRLALLSALSDRAEIGRVTVVDDWKITAPKTKDAATILRKLKLTGSVLVVAGPRRAGRRALLRQPARGADDDVRRALGPRRAAGRLAALLRPHAPRLPHRDFSGDARRRGGRDAGGAEAPATEKTAPSKADATEATRRPRRAEAEGASRQAAKAASQGRATEAKPERRGRGRRRQRGGRRRCVTPCRC